MGMCGTPGSLSPHPGQGAVVWPGPWKDVMQALQAVTCSRSWSS